jgi:lipopolysaccharide transport system ATP-binding protein
MGIRVRDQLERNIFTTQTQLNNFVKKEGSCDLLIKIPASVLVPNKYTIIVGLHIPNQEIVVHLESPVQFSIEETGSDFFQYPGVDNGCVIVNCDWKII